MKKPEEPTPENFSRHKRAPRPQPADLPSRDRMLIIKRGIDKWLRENPKEAEGTPQ